MASGLNLSLDLVDSLDQIPSALAATEREIAQAVRRALAALGRWLSLHSRRELGYSLSIPQQALARRFRVYARGLEVRVWVGTYALGVHRLGKPQQTTEGVKVGRRDYAGAFIDPMKSDQPLVWKRRGKGRLPIDRVEEEFAPEVPEVIERWEARCAPQFATLLDQELRAITDGHIQPA